MPDEEQAIAALLAAAHENKELDNLPWDGFLILCRKCDSMRVRLENNLRYLMGEELINYLGSDYTNE